MKWAFFGGSEFSVYVLNELISRNIKPDLIITTPDKPKGRKLVLAPTPVKIWAQECNVEVINPVSLKKDAGLVSKLEVAGYEMFLVASYGKIIPKEIFEIPKYKTLNIHPSILPKYRGASPIQAQILNDEREVGVTIMQIDEEMDHGPIVAQKSLSPTKLSNDVEVDEAPLSLSRRGGLVGEDTPGRKKLEKILAIEGAGLFVEILPDWMAGKIKPTVQDENKATFCQKIEKEDGELQIDLNDLSKNARQNFLKIKAFEEWPTAYFFIDASKRNNKDDPGTGSNKRRIIITDATLENNVLKILRVIPEGKKEMLFEDFLRGNKNRRG